MKARFDSRVRRVSNLRVLETVKSLGLGGAQALIAERLRCFPERARETLVYNALGAEDAFSPKIRDSGAAVVDRSWRGLAAAEVALRGLIDEFRPDVIVVHSPSIGALTKLDRWRGRIRVPVVEIVHNTKYSNRLAELAAVVTNPGADLLACVSQGALDSGLCRRGSSRTVLRHGVDLLNYRRWAAGHESWIHAERTRLLGSAGSTLGVFLGRLVPEKRPLELLEAIAEGPDSLSFVFVGGGPLEGELAKAVVRLRLQDRVAVLGPRVDGWRYLAVGDFLCLPSRNEGLPVVLMEALAFGLPMIVGDFDSADEIVTNGENGIILNNDLGDSLKAAIVRLSSDTDYRKLLGSGAVAASSVWDVHTTGSMFYERLKEVVRSAD